MGFGANKTPVKVIREGGFGGLVKMIKDVGSKFDDYSFSLKIRQILLHWGYELTEKEFFIDLTN